MSFNSGIVLAEFSDYDSFQTHIGDRDKVLREAKSYAYKVSQFMDLGDPEHVKLVEKLVTKSEWVVEDD